MAATLVGDFRKPVVPGALAGAGLGGALRYWAKQGGSSVVVGITETEAAAYVAAKIPLGTIYEAPAANWMSGGGPAGEKAGKWLLTQFKAASWTPSSLYLAADANTLAAAVVNECLDGAAQALGFMPDLYAYIAPLQAAQGVHARRSWLTGHFPGASIAAVQKAYPWMHLYQCQGSQPAGIPTTVTVSGVEGDVDIALREDWNAMTDPNTLLNTQYSVDSQPKESVGRRIQRTEELSAAIDAEVDALPATLKAAIATALSGAAAGAPTGTYPVTLTIAGATVATGSLVVGQKQAS